MCPTHGGSLPRTRNAARVRLTEYALQRDCHRAYAQWQQRVLDWNVQRVLTTADLLGMDPAKVTRWDIWVCRWTHGVPAGDDEAPKRRGFDQRVTRYVDSLYGRDGRNAAGRTLG